MIYISVVNTTLIFLILKVMKNKNLIGISGKISSGKDTVGNIIQIITAMPHLTDVGVLSFLNREITSPYQIKKYADKLKDIVCILLSCTREQLEDRDFKEKELGEEWTIFKANLPNPTSGFFEEYSKIFTSSSDLSKYFFDKGYNKFSVNQYRLTPRLLLQLLGTECGREILHPNLWVNALFANYKPIGDTLLEGEVRKVRQEDLIYPNWIITDVRFPNELEAIKQRNGITIRVERPYQTVEGEGNGNWATFSQTQFHPSETSLDYVTDWSYVIENNGTLEDLVKKVREILISENII